MKKKKSRFRKKIKKSHKKERGDDCGRNEEEVAQLARNKSNVLAHHETIL
jgi:hypothetical protein